MIPNWENTCNGELGGWWNIGYAQRAAEAAGYRWFLWTDGHVYQANHTCSLTRWVKADLYNYGRPGGGGE
jgi:hypothetical protein